MDRSESTTADPLVVQLMDRLDTIRREGAHIQAHGDESVHDQ